MAGLTRTYLTFAVNDVKPVVFTVTSSTGSLPISAKYNLIDHGNGGTAVTGQQAIAMSVSGSQITTPLITWATISTFIVQVQATFADGVIDNSIIAQVTVSPLPT